MYNNEVDNGRHRGYWLIDNNGIKQPIYHTHANFYRRAKTFVSEYESSNGRPPSHEEFSQFGADLLEKQP